jgi:hypothetical protein
MVLQFRSDTFQYVRHMSFYNYALYSLRYWQGRYSKHKEDARGIIVLRCIIVATGDTFAVAQLNVMICYYFGFWLWKGFVWYLNWHGMNVRTSTFVFFVIIRLDLFHSAFLLRIYQKPTPHPANGRFLRVNSCGLAVQSQLNDHNIIIRQFLLSV